MKKCILLWCLCAALLLALSACGGGTPSAPTTTAAPETTAAPVTTVASGTEAPVTTAPPTTTAAPSHSHVFGGWSVVTPSTCKQDGRMERSCTCGHTEERKLARPSHEYVGGVCELCGEEEPSHRHTFGNWSVVMPATCKQDGRMERSCSCGHTEERKLARASHEYVGGVCELCGAKDPNYVPEVPNTVGAEAGNAKIAVQGDWIYFSPSYYELARVRLDGSGEEVIYSVTTGRILNINVVGEWVYFYCEGDTPQKSYIGKVKTDGTGFEKPVSGVYIGEFLVVKDTLYFTTLKSPYQNFGKDVYPLYRTSVNGGIPTQIHDGAARGLVATDSYLYFIYAPHEGNDSICCVRHGRTQTTVLYTAKEIRQLSVGDSRLYFTVQERLYTVWYECESAITSIPLLGGAPTVHAVFPYGSELLHAVGDKIYYFGSPCSVEDQRDPEYYGLCAYDLKTNTFTLVKRAGPEDYEEDYHPAGDYVIKPRYQNELFSHIEVYGTQP